MRSIAHPFNQLTRIARAKRATVEKLKHTQDRCLAASVPVLRERVQELNHELESSEVDGTYHPYLFYWTHKFRSAIEREDESKAKSLIAVLPQTYRDVKESHRLSRVSKRQDGFAIDLTTPMPSQQDLIATGSRLASRLNKRKIELRYHPRPNNLPAAFELISSSGFSPMVQAVVTNLLFFAGKPAIGYSDVKLCGAVFLRHDLVEHDALELAEAIVHEASHNQLNLFMNAEAILLNDDIARYRTPLRRDLRPMYGLFHQCFVLANLGAFYHSLEGHIDEKKREGKLEQIGEHFLSAIDVVQEHAELTDPGQSLLEEMAGYGHTIH